MWTVQPKRREELARCLICTLLSRLDRPRPHEIMDHATDSRARACQRSHPRPARVASHVNRWHRPSRGTGASRHATGEGPTARDKMVRNPAGVQLGEGAATIGRGEEAMPCLEDRYADILTVTPRATLHALAGQAHRALSHRHGVKLLRQRDRRARRDTLTRAASRMHGDDLDAAFLAALRGDLDRAEAIMAGSVGPDRRDTFKGTPWRKSGWLSSR